MPLSQVFFALQNVPQEALKLPNLALEQQKVESGTVKFDLSFFMSEEDQGLRAAWCTTPTCSTMTPSNGCWAPPDAPERHRGRPRSAPLRAAAAERGGATSTALEWNDTATEYPQDRCVHELFEEQVERTPDAVAVVFEEQQLTYRELNRRANQLAHHLRTLGVGPEVLVGICLERGIDLVVALLAT